MRDALELWDWCRRIADLYHDARASPDARAGWQLWCETRAEMFRSHPQSPIAPIDREAFDGP